MLGMPAATQQPQPPSNTLHRTLIPTTNGRHKPGPACIEPAAYATAFVNSGTCSSNIPSLCVSLNSKSTGSQCSWIKFLYNACPKQIYFRSQLDQILALLRIHAQQSLTKAFSFSDLQLSSCRHAILRRRKPSQCYYTSFPYSISCALLRPRHQDEVWSRHLIKDRSLCSGQILYVNIAEGEALPKNLRNPKIKAGNETQFSSLRLLTSPLENPVQFGLVQQLRMLRLDAFLPISQTTV